jgi:ketosteroid isomerase-like protein
MLNAQLRYTHPSLERGTPLPWAPAPDATIISDMTASTVADLPLLITIFMDANLEAEIVARETALLRAVTTNDVALLDDLLHDDLLFNGPDGQTGTKAQDLANYRSGGIHLRRAEASDRLVHAIGDDVVVAVTVTLEGSYLGVRADGRYRYLRVWKRFGGAWRVIAGSVVALGAS